MALKIDFPIKIETVETYDRYRIKKPVPIAVQGDDIGRRLAVSFTQKGEPIDISSCSAQVKCSYNDALIAVNDCAIENNTVVVTLTSAMLANAGEHKLQVSLFDENGATVSGNIITIQVTESIPTGEVEDTEDFSALSTLTAQIKSITVSDAELKGARGNYPLLSNRLNANDVIFADLTRFLNAENLVKESADPLSASPLTDGYYAENCQLSIEDGCVAVQSDAGGDCTAYALFDEDFTINSDGISQALTAMRIKSVGKTITAYPIGGVTDGEKNNFCSSNIINSNYNKITSTAASITLTQDKWVTVWGLIGGNGSNFKNGTDVMNFNGLGVHIPAQSDNSAPKLLIQCIKAYSGNVDINSSLSAIEEELARTNNSITSIQSNLNSNSQSVSTMQTELNTVSDEVKDLANTVSANTAGITSLKTTSADTENKLSALAVDSITHSKEIASIQARLLDDEEKLADTEESVAEIQGNISDLSNNIGEVKELLGVYEPNVLGLQVDYENKVFTRLAGAYGKTAGADFDVFPMFGGRKRCNVADDGTINAYYGDDSYAEDGSNGQVMVYQPKFYYKVVPLKLEKIADGVGYHIRKANYYVSDTPHEGFKVHPVFFDQSGNEVEYVLFSAYEGSMWDASESAYFNDGTDTDTTIDTAADLICSVANVKPISGHKKPITKDNFETLSKNRGTGWHCDTIRSVSANQLLMLIELGTLNTQAVIGDGVVSIASAGAYNCSSLTGSTAILGNTSGQATETINEIAGTETTYSTAGKVSVTYRGIENPWGNIWKHINGINIWGDGSMRGGQPYVANDYNFNDSKHDDNYRGVGYTLPTTSGYISAMGYGCDDFDWLFIPTETSGTSTLPVGDYTNVGDNVNGYRTALLGAYWNNGGSAGGHSWHCSNPVGTSNRYIGGRLLFVPTATV